MLTRSSDTIRRWTKVLIDGQRFHVLFVMFTHHLLRSLSTKQCERIQSYVNGESTTSLGWKDAREGAAINLHLAANLMLEQISLTAQLPATSAETSQQKETAVGAQGKVGNHLSGASGRVTSLHGPRTNAGMVKQLIGAGNEPHVSAVDGAICESVVETELNDVSMVRLIRGLIDRDAVLAKRRMIIDVARRSGAKMATN